VLPLRFPWFWATIGWLLVAGVVFGSLLPGPAMRGVAVGDKLLHAASYCLLMLWFGGLYARRRHVVIALALFAFGFALDALQATTATRSFDLRDIAANGSGILIGLALTAWRLEGWCQRLERSVLALTS
jgi:VanZ family protein